MARNKINPLCFTFFILIHKYILAPTEFLSVISHTSHYKTWFMWNSLQHSGNTSYCTYENLQQLPSRHTHRYIHMTAILSDFCYKTYAVVWLHSTSRKKIMWWTQVKRSSTLSPGPEGLVSPITVHTDTVLITHWTLTEGTVLLLLGGWFLLSQSSRSPCWWQGGLAAPYSQSVHDRIIIYLGKIVFIRKIIMLNGDFIQVQNTHSLLHILTLAVSGNADSFAFLVQILTSPDTEMVNGITPLAFTALENSKNDKWPRQVYQDSINSTWKQILLDNAKMQVYVHVSFCIYPLYLCKLPYRDNIWCVQFSETSFQKHGFTLKKKKKKKLIGSVVFTSSWASLSRTVQ